MRAPQSGLLGFPPPGGVNGMVSAGSDHAQMERSPSTLPTWMETEPRLEARASVNLPAKLTGPAGEARAVTIVDLTTLGCRIEADFRLTVGAYVTLLLPTDGAISGWVAWAKGGALGVDFSKPLAAESIAAVLRQQRLGMTETE